MTGEMTAFDPGAHLALVADTTVMLVGNEGMSLRDEVWRLVRDEVSIDEILDSLSSHGLRSLPSFVLARDESDRTVRVVVRGDASVTLATVSGDRVVSAGDVKTWVEEVVPDVLSLTLEIGTSFGHSTPPTPFEVGVGVFGAAWLRRGVDVETSVPDGLPSDSGARSPVPLAAGLAAEPTVAEPVSDPVAEASVGDPANPEAVTELSELSEDDASSDVVPPAAAPDGATLSQASLASFDLLDGIETSSFDPDTHEDDDDLTLSPDSDSADDGASGKYDFLFGQTVARSVQGAAVHAEESDPAAEQGVGPTGRSSAGKPGMISVPPPATPIASTPSAAPRSAFDPALGDHDGQTISRAQLANMRQGSGVAPAGPMVQSVLCSQRHANPPSADRCSMCGSPLAGASIVNVPRPTLGAIRLSSGVTIPLDRPLVIGRNPRIEGLHKGEMPAPVKVEDTGQGLSRTHCAIHLEGWQVLIEDLGSSNGTEVTLPGRAPQRLHPGEPVRLEPATHVDLGGEITFVYLAES